MDQLLGRDAGRVVNDEAVAVAVGGRSPELAGKGDRKILVRKSDLGKIGEHFSLGQFCVLPLILIRYRSATS
jgi:hypothetical protein